MLGKLFSTAASTLTPRSTTSGSSRETISLESVQEDIHTRNLLFPDAEALYQHQHDQVFPLSSSAAPLLTSSASAFDVNSDIDLDLKDARVVIMQEATSLQVSSALLYDSHPLIEPSSPIRDRKSSITNDSANVHRSNSGRTITTPRKTSIGQTSKPVIITHEGSIPRSPGAFDRRPSSHARAASYIETEGQRTVREYKEEMTTFSNCIFGSSDVMAYKGTGTKVHIIPTETKSPSYPFGDGHGSLGRSTMRASKLAQSYTSDNIVPAPVSAGLPGAGSRSRSLDRKKVLITRIFPVPLPNDHVEHPTPLSQHDGSDASGSYPFPSVDEDLKPKEKIKPTQKKTPMYAIGLIIHLPSSPHLTCRAGFQGPGSYTDRGSSPSSYNSLKPGGWTVLGNGFGIDSLESSVFSDFDDRIDIITQHWDIIKRTLTCLQAVVSNNLLPMLKQADITSPDPANLRAMSSHLRTLSSSVSVSGKRVVETTMKPFKVAEFKMVQLPPNALAYEKNIKMEVDEARQRIVGGIKYLPVVTRQGRWGIWREEARWVRKWARKHEELFFYSLLTGFLGNHTEWLRALAPDSYRRHHYQQQRANREDDSAIFARTIIVAQDKMAARRLVFLLSAFLPSNQQQQFSLNRAYRPSTSASFDGYSQSPPSYAPSVLREESLRRKVKRRNGPPRGTHSRTMSFQTSASNADSGTGAQTHERRNSDAISLKTANLPIPGSDGGSRKSSAATTTTVTPNTTIPHFSTRRPVRGTGPIPRPGSSGSLAADEMIRTLTRGESTGHNSSGSSDLQSNSRWSMISRVWNGKRGSSNTTDATSPIMESSVVDDSRLEMKKNKLAQMVDEAQKQQREQGTASEEENHLDLAKAAPTSLSFATPEEPLRSQQRSQERAPMYPGGDYESSVKTSINEEDGVIDIDVPLPDFFTSSFGSTMSSPSSSGYLSARGFGPGLEGFEHYSRRGPDTDPPLNVGGWLPRYHPDFVLQAVPAQEHLEADIKASMAAEPTPAIGPASHGEVSRWVDVSSALIADVTNFTLRRIRYRRHVLLVNPNKHQTCESGTLDTKSQSVHGNPYIMASHIDGLLPIIDESYTEDAVITMDEMLINALEQMISQTPNHHLSKPGSSSSSRSTSRGRSNSTSKGVSHSAKEEQLKVPVAHLELPRGECKKMILGTLEEIARQVADSVSEETDTSMTSDKAKRTVEKESFLREGIRNWFASMEEWT